MFDFETTSQHEKWSVPVARSTPKRRMIYVVVYFALTVTGIGAIAYAGQDYLAALEARAAELEPVEAQLQRADVKRNLTTGPRGRRAYGVHVAYSYSFNGQEFEGRRLGFGRDKWQSSLSEAEAEKIVREIQDREPFIVYVDERDPRKSVVFDDRTGIIGAGTIFVTLFGCAFVLIGGFSLVVELASWLRSTR